MHDDNKSGEHQADLGCTCEIYHKAPHSFAAALLWMQPPSTGSYSCLLAHQFSQRARVLHLRSCSPFAAAAGRQAARAAAGLLLALPPRPLLLPPASPCVLP